MNVVRFHKMKVKLDNTYGGNAESMSWNLPDCQPQPCSVKIAVSRLSKISAWGRCGTALSLFTAGTDWRSL